MSFATLAKRLHAAVDRSGGPDACWPWIRSTRNGGYGQLGGFENGERYVLGAHRVAYELHHGVKLSVDQCVLHRCDNPPCCNPAHLFLGDRQANADDKMAKGRHRFRTHRGTSHGMSKLTDDAVRALRAEYAAGGIGQVPLARKYGISQATCWAILHRKIWAHVDNP